ncbi:MAG: hypothetical protein ACTSPB_21080 [Candidatus Thorarchaeota archaeon]
MEEEELRELKQREIEKATNNVNEMIKQNKINDIELLYRDKFNLEGKKYVIFQHGGFRLLLWFPSTIRCYSQFYPIVHQINSER